MDWLRVHRGDAPLVIAFPHGGTDLAGLDEQFATPWHARLDTDWWIAELYAFAADMGATLVATDISRSVIDMNRDPSGASLYPGQATTELCPTTTFDGEPLYAGATPDEAEIARRRATWFDPYHAALEQEVARLRALHPRIVFYDAHSIRSHVPRLFDGELPQFNIGTNDGATCDPELTEDVIDAITGYGAENWSAVVNGRFKGGWTTRHFGRPADGVHAIQMELAIRGYMDEPDAPNAANWPPPLNPQRAAPLAATLTDILTACLAFAAPTKG